MSSSIGSENKTSRRKDRTQGARKPSCGDEAASAKEDHSEKTNGEASKSKRKKASKKVAEDVIPPEQRAIPDTPLRSSLGKHPSVYAKEDHSEKANCEASKSKRIKASKKVAEDAIPPEQRAIPDTPLLHSLGKHPSVYARLGQANLTQNLNFRGAWPIALGLYRQAHDEYKQLFVAAGFGEFLKIDAVHIPQAYLVALMERWFSETNTLHLACCEIGPTPVDWNMITGLRFRGKPISLNKKFPMNQALELLGVDHGAVTEGKIRLSSITPTVEEVKVAPASDESKEVMFRRLFLYVVGSCFFNNNRSVMNHEFVKYLEFIDEVGSHNWGAITFAAFLAGMRRKVTGETGAFTGFWPFLLFWAFEYLEIFRPKVAEDDVFPRAIRWSCPHLLASADSSNLFAARCQLDYIEEAQVTWQPYLGSAQFGSNDMEQTILLAQKRVPFWAVDTWEYYLGERCRRQLGFPCRVPFPPPGKMHGNYDVLPEDEIGVGRPTDTLVMDEIEDYSSWFATHSIGKIVDLGQFLGGAETGSRVLCHWLAVHHPDRILILRSEYEAMKEACEAAVAECKMLRAKLVTSVVQMEDDEPIEIPSPVTGTAEGQEPDVAGPREHPVSSTRTTSKQGTKTSDPKKAPEKELYKLVRKSEKKKVVANKRKRDNFEESPKVVKAELLPSNSTGLLTLYNQDDQVIKPSKETSMSMLDEVTREALPKVLQALGEYSSHGWYLAEENSRLERENKDVAHALTDALSANEITSASLQLKVVENTALMAKNASLSEENAALKEKVEELAQQSVVRKQELDALRQVNTGGDEIRLLL